MAVKGYYLFRGDKTRCGGVITEGWTDHQHFDKDMACEGHKVTCGKHPGLYRICGGLDDDYIHGKRIAGTLHSYSSCPCKSKFLNSNWDDDYELGGEATVTHTDLSHLVEIPVLPGPINSPEPEQHAQTAKKKTGIDAGFAVIPYGGTTEAWQRLLFTENPPAGAKELFATLNGPDERYKAGSIMLLVDPDKQDDEQIAHMKAAKARVDAALEPLTIQEANFLHKNKDTIDLFTSRASTTTGIASEAAGKYFEKIESVLVRIQQAYKNQYITSGSLISEQFYVQRRQLFSELDSILTDFTRHKLALQDYPDIKRALGLSTSSITHRWNQTGVADIEGYATFIEKAAKYVKMMKTAGYVGIALDGVNRLDKIYEACTVGSDCEKTTYTEVGSFGMSIGGGVFAGSLASGGASATVCSFVLGALTIEAAGAGMLACGVIFTGAAGYAGGEIGGKLGETLGEKVYEVTK
ncbi:PAAR domain-containing protein [Raoultella planticola]|uniref:PAAR domain-containing protein n=2 Tax=Raoultella planticola TaxID=575 RepID=UPI001A2EE3EA|nr:PAAR domain-containing protein [Raoultella planticola]EJR0224619.1 PAAR domain-containing protein [Raoultella planticola]EJR0351468.1 PAAR domain-containing protein [Raoultella planticola]MDV1448690.1 PAAR domain-containing protein [Raoultella planticola]MDV1565838.1 PAAR domain-containing protein [Raoultella planticola]MDV1570435.1 PAAR domain-containing protein [Raoultella planticola]